MCPWPPRGALHTLLQCDDGCDEFVFMWSYILELFACLNYDSSILQMHKQQKEDLERVLTLDPTHARARALLQKVSPHHSLVLNAGVTGLSCS